MSKFSEFYGAFGLDDITNTRQPIFSFSHLKMSCNYVSNTKGKGGQTGISADTVVGGVHVGVPLLVPSISLELMGVISLNLHGYITGYNLRAT